MKANELATKSTAELQDELYALLKQQFNLRMQKATNQLTATHQMKVVRRDIARLKTVMRQKVGETHE